MIPKAGHRVMVLVGEERGKSGKLKSVSVGEGFGVVVIGSKEVELPFNHISRYDAEEE